MRMMTVAVVMISDEGGDDSDDGDRGGDGWPWWEQ